MYFILLTKFESSYKQKRVGILNPDQEDNVKVREQLKYLNRLDGRGFVDQILQLDAGD